MPQTPGTGSYEQVLRMMAIAAGSSAFKVEMDILRNQLKPKVLQYPIVDANGVVVYHDLGEKQFLNTSWLHDKLQAVHITPAVQILPPFPSMQLIGGTSQNAPHAGGNVEERWGASYLDIVDAVCFANQDDVQSAQREALLLCQAYQQLIRRNDNFGGLVQLIRPLGRVQPGGGGTFKNMGLVMAARARFEVRTLYIDNSPEE